MSDAQNQEVTAQAPRPRLGGWLYLARLGAVLVLLALVLSTGILRVVSEVTQYVRGPRLDPISFSESRFQPLRPALRGVASAGYVADDFPSGSAWPPADDRITRRFYLAQYALAPVVLSPSADAALVIGHFTDEPAAQRFVAAHRNDWRILARGRAVILFQRSSR